MPTFRYRLTEYEPDKPWLIVSIKNHLTVELPSAVSFAEWARERWPGPTFQADLEPGQLDRLI